MLQRIICIISFGFATLSWTSVAASPLKLAVFSVDASPAVGSPLAYDPTAEITLPLSCRGVVLLGAGKPIVLCAVDWIGIGNESQAVFREALARAAGTNPERVAVHTLHQHDAPRCDFLVDRLLAPYGINSQFFDSAFARTVIHRAQRAITDAVQRAVTVTHLGLGEARVQKVASNRRILDEDGKVRAMRWTACKDPELRALPAGTIDPMLKMISFWRNGQAVAALTYYATHPQSYYRTGGANPDFPGMARNQREEQTGIFHLHFNGAGGNIGAGKWNDGAPQNRQILADRLAGAMAVALASTNRSPIDGDDVGWATLPVRLPVSRHLDREKLEAQLRSEGGTLQNRLFAAGALAWLDRAHRGDTTDISCLRLGNARVLHMPGELFVEYQLGAQRMRPQLFVAMAAYGDYGPGYIGTKLAYQQGGYETSPTASLVAPEVEESLMDAIKVLLERVEESP